MGYNATVHSGNNHFTTFTIISRTNENSWEWERSNNEVKLVSMIWGNSEYHVNMFTTTMLLTNMKYESFHCNHFELYGKELHYRQMTIIHALACKADLVHNLMNWWLLASIIYLFIYTNSSCGPEKQGHYRAVIFFILFLTAVFLRNVFVMFAK